MLFSFGATANGYAQNKKTNIASDFDKVGWKVGIQSYTFTRYSLFDAIDAAADLGLKYVEATIWQTIERGKEERFNPWQMSEETKQKIKNKCLEKDITLTSFYCRPSKEDAENGQTEKLFQFRSKDPTQSHFRKVVHIPVLFHKDALSGKDLPEKRTAAKSDRKSLRSCL